MADERTNAMDRLLATQGSEESPIEKLYTTDATLKMKSEIPTGLVLDMATAYTVADITGSKELTKFCDYILQLQISKDRKGRIEYMESIVARLRQSEEE